MKHFKKGFTYLFLTCLATNSNAEVSFSQILNDPDNIELNQAFIDERIKAGDLPPALSAVERIIQLQPLNVGARILRAQLLISLGNYATAKTEIDALDFYTLPESQQREVDRLKEQITTELSPWTTAGSVALSFDYDNNIGAITDSGTTLGSAGEVGTSFDSEGFSTKRSDTALGVTTSITSTYDLGLQTNDNAYFILNARNSVGDDSDLKNLHSVGITSGAVLSAGPYTTNTYVGFDHTHRNSVKNDGITVKRDDIATISAGTKISRQFGPTNVQLGYSFSRSDFSGRSVSDLSDAKSHGITFGVFKMLGTQSAIFSNIGYQQRRAIDRDVATAVASQDRNVVSASLGSTRIFGDYQRVTASLNRRNLDYQRLLSGSDQFIRDDKETTVSLSYQVDGRAITQTLDGWSFFATANRVRNDSNMATYDVTNNYLSMGVSFQF